MADGNHMNSARSLRPFPETKDGSPIASPMAKLEVLSDQRDINIKLEQLLKEIKNGDTEQIEQYARDIQRRFSGVQQYLSLTIQAKYYAQHRPYDTQIAEKVFAIPELMESISTNLEVLDLMRCYEVNRTFRDTIESSIKLQTCLFLRPDPTQRKASFPLRTKYIRCYNQARVNIISRTGRTYNLGLRWKKMLVRQPPVHKMECRAECQSEHRPCLLNWRGASSKVLTSEDGLTIGELFEAVQEMAEQHRIYCGSGSRGRVTVIFDGPKELRLL